MLNMLDTQDKLKNFSEAQLIQEMQMPSGSAPQFMVLGEIERRKRMRQDAMRQEGLMQPTVAQEAVSAAGVPQQGIAQVAQSLAPKTDMTQNTGVPNVQAAGLPAQPNQPVKMADGGRLTLMQTDPATIAMASRMGMSVDDYISSLTPSAIDANLQRIARATANEGRVYDDVFSPQRPVYAQGVNPLDIEETYGQMRDNIRDEEIMALGVNPSFATDTRDREYGIGISDRMATPSTSEGIRVLLPQADLPPRASADDMYVPAGAPIPTPDELPVGQKPTLMDTLSNTAAILSVGASQEDKRAASTALGGDGLTGGDRRANELAEINARLADPRLSENMRSALETRKDVLLTGESIARIPEATGNIVDRAAAGVRGYIDPVIASGISTFDPEAGARFADESERIRETFKQRADESDEAYAARRATLEGSQGVTTGTPIEVPAEGIGALMPPQRGGTPFVAQPTRAPITPAITPTAPAMTGGAGGAGGAGGSGGAAPAEKSGIEAAKSKMDQDKWLALAQAGLTLMSTGDFGKAGSAGLASLQQAKAADREERKLEAELMLREAQMAAANRSGRGGGSGGGLTANQLLSRGNDLIKSGQSMLEAAGDNADAADEARALIEAGRNLIRQVTGGTSTSATGAIKLPSAG